jgi:hypothetical protein
MSGSSSLKQTVLRDGTIGNCYVADLETNGEREILVSRVDGTRTWLEVYNARPKELLRKSAAILTPDRDGRDGWDGGMRI